MSFFESLLIFLSRSHLEPHNYVKLRMRLDKKKDLCMVVFIAAA